MGHGRIIGYPEIIFEPPEKSASSGIHFRLTHYPVAAQFALPGSRI
jgi:hypothetical protein